jgi:hypothetical protein
MKIVPVVRKALLKDIDESYEDMLYWLSRPPQVRIAEVTRLISFDLKPGQRMDKTVVVKRQLHPIDDMDKSEDL